MNPLNVNRINIYAPYKIWSDGDVNPYYTAYWFNLTNPEHAKSPGDTKIAQTVVCIIENRVRGAHRATRASSVRRNC